MATTIDARKMLAKRMRWSSWIIEVDPDTGELTEGVDELAEVALLARLAMFELTVVAKEEADWMKEEDGEPDNVSEKLTSTPK